MIFLGYDDFRDSNRSLMSVSIMLLDKISIAIAPDFVHFLVRKLSNYEAESFIFYYSPNIVLIKIEDYWTFNIFEVKI